MTNENQFSRMALAALKAKTNSRKAEAIALYDRGNGLDVNEIAKQLGLSRRTVKRYLPHAK